MGQEIMGKGILLLLSNFIATCQPRCHIQLDVRIQESVLFMSSIVMCNCLICYALSITVYAQMYNTHDVNSKYDCVLFGSFLTYYHLIIHLYKNI